SMSDDFSEIIRRHLCVRQGNRHTPLCRCPGNDLHLMKYDRTAQRSVPTTLGGSSILWSRDHVFALVAEDLERFVEDRSQLGKDRATTNATTFVVLDWSLAPVLNRQSRDS
ncbi:MAG: hypothetical protein ACKOOI_17675, partial [Pirellula sp.]